MAEGEDAEWHVEILRIKVGNMSSDKEIVIMDDITTEDECKEYNLILFGKLLSSPSINFQAIQSTMKRA